MSSPVLPAPVSLTVTPEVVQLVASVAEDFTLQLSNLTITPVMYRVLTTTAARYAVKPSRGVLPPCSSEAISIVLKEHNVPSTTHDDFKIEYAQVLPSDVIDTKYHNVVTILKAIRDEGKQAKTTPVGGTQRSVHQTKIRCSILVPSVGSVGGGGGGGGEGKKVAAVAEPTNAAVSWNPIGGRSTLSSMSCISAASGSLNGNASADRSLLLGCGGGGGGSPVTPSSASLPGNSASSSSSPPTHQQQQQPSAPLNVNTPPPPPQQQYTTTTTSMISPGLYGYLVGILTSLIAVGLGMWLTSSSTHSIN